MKVAKVGASRWNATAINITPPEVWMEDLRRQRALERAGWIFWRCWGSSFASDPKACMTDLFHKLSEMGIEPIGAAEIDLSEIVEYREISDEEACANSRDAFNEKKSEASNEANHNDRGVESKPSRSTSTPRNQIARPPSSPVSQAAPRQGELLSTESALPLWTDSKPETISSAIEVGDSVRYCFVETQDDESFVTIVPYDSNSNLGMINAETAIAKALLGFKEGDESDVVLPAGRQRLRILAVHKPRRG